MPGRARVSPGSMRRTGADLIVTYGAVDAARRLASVHPVVEPRE